MKQKSNWTGLSGEKAMDAKIEQLKNLDTYKTVELPANHTPITNTWVYCLKYDHNRSIVCYKACLITKGFSQIPEINFIKTFILVICLNTLWLLLTITTKLGLTVRIVNIVGAYLNGDLKEKI